MSDSHNSCLIGRNTYFPPTRILNEKIRARDWDACRLRILYYAQDAKFVSKNMNNATPLHLACLYRAPYEIVELILNANPQALLYQDSEGWTPIHVVLLYGSDDETALMLIRRGGPHACSIQSKLVGTPLHLACRHGCSTAIIKELLRANPEMATQSNEYSTKPARILWHQYARNSDNERFLQDLINQQGQVSPPDNQIITDLIDRLALLVRAANGRYPTEDNRSRSVLVHDVVVATEDTLGDLSQFVALVVFLYPEQVRSKDEAGDLPLHKAARNPPSSRARNDSLRRSGSLPSFTSSGLVGSVETYSNDGDPVGLLLQQFPLAARIPNNQGLMPLHLALARGRRTWRTGVAAIVYAAPELVTARCTETNLYPFQLAAMEKGCIVDDREHHVETVETILELLLACPHLMVPCRQGMNQ